MAKAGTASPVQQGQAIKGRTFPLVTVSQLFKHDREHPGQKQAVSPDTLVILSGDWVGTETVWDENHHLWDRLRLIPGH